MTLEVLLALMPFAALAVSIAAIYKTGSREDRKEKAEWRKEMLENFKRIDRNFHRLSVFLASKHDDYDNGIE